MRRRIIIAGFTVVAAGLLLIFLLGFGKAMRSYLDGSYRYQLSFDQIECPVPPGVNRDDFLSEVRYYGELPTTISVLDETLREQLTTAFERHGWVEKVDKVEIGPGKRVQVRLTLHVAVLAVVMTDQRGTIVRAFNTAAAPLPPGGDTLALPHLHLKSPGGMAKPWELPEVKGAVAVAGLLREHQTSLNLKDFRWEAGQLRLRRGGDKPGPEVIWGHAPGKEAKDEPPAERKLQRLLEQVTKLDEEKAGTIDLRK